ncbi:MAG TPA: hypothetical protein VG498_21905, partial [Terriglobales bacterium]|nr:hypothetical protein [Terriglobales bacterium]
GTSIGANVAPFPYQSLNNANWQNYSAWCKIPAGSITNTASSVKLTMQFTAGGSANIGAIKLFLTAPDDPTVVSSVAMTVAGSASPTIAIPSSTTSSSRFTVTTDPAAITIDGTQDIYIVAYFDNSASNASVGVASQNLSGGPAVFGGFVSGDQTGMNNVTTSLGTAAMAGTNTMNLFTRLMVAP